MYILGEYPNSLLRVAAMVPIELIFITLYFF